MDTKSGNGCKKGNPFYLVSENTDWETY